MEKVIKKLEKLQEESKKWAERYNSEDYKAGLETGIELAIKEILYMKDEMERR
ncbi:hypothetical protein [Sigmofec virus UA08Rod_5492]|uniref:Uncharacterized protein n=1 Tax=Sigmofec virus UA08Rod_5492 TaxID=2929426 RepID=A0A976R6Z0_9VIRU|nr:hypothetical protein [Sigmofec virus UA08Rod_5492]